MSHKPTGKGPCYGEFNFAKGGSVFVRGYMRGGKVSQPKVEKVMHEFKSGDLHSGSKSGPVVGNKKQAIAIALSEGRKAAKGMASGGKVDEYKDVGTLSPVTVTAKKKAIGGVVDTMQQKVKAHATPKISNVSPRSMNVKARMAATYAKGGLTMASDTVKDKAMIRKAISQHDEHMHGGAKEQIALKKGGKAK